MCIITDNNIIHKISSFSDLFKKLAELELNLKLFFEANGIDLYRQNGESKFKNLGQIREAFEAKIKHQDDEVKMFWENHKKEIQSFINYRNALIHGNLRQALLERLISKQNTDLDLTMEEKRVINADESKSVRDLIVSFCDTQRFTQDCQRIDTINKDIQRLIGKYLAGSSNMGLVFLGW